MSTLNPLYARRHDLHREIGEIAHARGRRTRQQPAPLMPRTDTLRRRGRKTPRERTLDAPVLILKIDEEIQRLRKEPEWISGHENGITLSKYPHLRGAPRPGQSEFARFA